MDIEEIKNLKHRSEIEVFNVLRSFEKLTSCSVYDVNLLIETPMGSENGMIVDVSLKVQL